MMVLEAIPDIVDKDPVKIVCNIAKTIIKVAKVRRPIFIALYPLLLTVGEDHGR